ncbi:MAG: hypothetical protein ABW189_07150 [Rickettsiales bacterium]
MFKKKAAGLTLRQPAPEYIPAACMYDPETVVTKSGELMQALKVTGFAYESIGSERMDLRETVRKAIRGAIRSDKFAVWIHTVRRRQNLDPGGEYGDYFTRTLDKNWRDLNGWEDKYVNEVYVSVLREGKAAEVNNLKSMLLSLHFNSYYKTHENHLAEEINELRNAVNAIVKVLAPFGVRKLSIYKHKDGVYYSDFLQFFGKLAHMDDEHYPVDMVDIAKQLNNYRIAFGYNTFEITADGMKRFGASFAMKEYHEMSLDSLDEMLQLPLHFTISQTVDFVNAKQAMQEFEEQYRILRQSGATSLLEKSGLKDVVENDAFSETDFGEGQIILTVYNDAVHTLQKDVERLEEAFNVLGVVAPRVDVGLEDAYWAQFPGNFAFISQKKKINSTKIAGLASLYNFPAGRRFDNHWGPAITIFYTAKGTPYFFNYHKDGETCGHAGIIGPFGAGKTVLLNFLLSASRKTLFWNGEKLRAQLFFLDPDEQSHVFIKAINGKYHTMCVTSEGRRTKRYPDGDRGRLCDPFVYAEESDVVFLAEWMASMLMYDPVEFGEEEAVREYRASFDAPLEEEAPIVPVHAPDFGLLEGAARRALALPPEKRSLAAAARFLPEEYARAVRPFLPGGKLEYLFSERRPFALDNEGVAGFGLRNVMKHPRAIMPTTFLLLNMIERSLDGKPAIVVLDEAWTLLNNRFFIPRLKDWFDRMESLNAVVLASTENVRNAGGAAMTADVVAKLETQIFLPNPHADDYSLSYSEAWKLSDAEFAMLESMNAGKREFMIKHGGDAVVCRLNLAATESVRALSSDAERQHKMEDAMMRAGTDPEEWLPVYYAETTSVYADWAEEK